MTSVTNKPICSDCENEIPEGFRHMRRTKLLLNGNWAWTHECVEFRI